MVCRRQNIRHAKSRQSLGRADFELFRERGVKGNQDGQQGWPIVRHEALGHSLQKESSQTHEPVIFCGLMPKI